MLATVHKHFFPKAEIVLVDLTTGEEAPMNDIMKMMLMAVSTGHQVEFITMLDEAPFQEFRTIISLLSYIRTTGGVFRKSLHMYDSCFTYVAECKGSPELLIEKLQNDLREADRDVIFSDKLPPELTVSRAPSRDDFQFPKALLERIHKRFPDSYDDIIKSGEYLSYCDVTALILIRRICEKIVNGIAEQKSFRGSGLEPFADRIQQLKRVGAISDVDKYYFDFFRNLGNAAAHPGKTDDAQLLPDRAHALSTFKVFENFLSQLSLR
jgi:phosphotransferase system HPr-like phosphotransfer protein